MPKILCNDFVKCRKNAVAEDSMVATKAAEVIRASGRGELGPGSVLRVVRLLFI